jgi:hypothetical protein
MGQTVNNMQPKQLNEESLKTQLSQDFWWIFWELSYDPNEFFYLCVNCILNRYVVPNVLCLHLKNVIYAARMVCTISQVCLRFLSGQPSTPTFGSIKVNMFSIKMSQLEIFLLMWLGGLTKAQVRCVLWTYIVYCKERI